MTNKVILDTDIGSDVDDAVALAYLLSHLECELLGVTTVTGESAKRASLASVLCQAAGKEISIYPGAEQPLRGDQKQTTAPQAQALSIWPHETRFSKGAAIDFMQRTIRAYPNEVTALAIGPLTNLAMLFLADPEIPSLLEGLVMMGGIYSETYPAKDKIETNVGLDPYAAEVVFHSNLRLLRAIGLDVTHRVYLTAEQVREQFSAPLLQPVLDFAEIWFEQTSPKITFHDPLAAAAIFESDLCSYRQGVIKVDLEGKPGKTTFQAGEAGAPHEVAVSVDPRRYFDHFFKIVR